MIADNVVKHAPGANERERFLNDAEAFAREVRDAAPFRYLRWLTGCSGDELETLIGKIYCDSLPESSTGEESSAMSALLSFGHPFAYALTKKWLWARAAFVESDFETIDRSYFDKWYPKIFAALKSPKRLTPRTAVGFPEFEITEPIGRTVSPRTLLGLFLAPAFIPWLLLRPPEAVRPRFLRAYRKALSFFAIYDGHFDRYPCRDFVTFADESNHPARYFAFRRRSPGRLIVIQNGAREIYPTHAFGMADLYFVFGEFAQKNCAVLRMRLGRAEVVGALCLNERHSLYLELKQKEAPGSRYDVLMIDQSIWPYNGVSRASGNSILKLMENLGEYHARRPGLRAAYQLRPYGASKAEKEAVLAAAGSRLRGVEILDNAGKGESYAAIYRSKLVVTFSSTLGIESFFFGAGKNALFVNYSDSAYQDFAPEPLFQLSGDGDYGAFERKLDELLLLRLEGIPASAKEHHAYFDGKVEERIAAALIKEQS